MQSSKKAAHMIIAGLNSSMAHLLYMICGLSIGLICARFEHKFRRPQNQAVSAVLTMINNKKIKIETIKTFCEPTIDLNLFV